MSLNVQKMKRHARRGRTIFGFSAWAGVGFALAGSLAFAQQRPTPPRAGAPARAPQPFACDQQRDYEVFGPVEKVHFWTNECAKKRAAVAQGAPVDNRPPMPGRPPFPGAANPVTDPDVLGLLPYLGGQPCANWQAVQPAWYKELPPTDWVYATVGGKTAAETALIQREAFAFLTTVSTGLGQREDETGRWYSRAAILDYLQQVRWLDAQALYRAQDTRGPGMMALRAAVHQQMLAALSPATVTLFRSTPQYQTTIRADQLGPLLARDAAGPADRGVFGIRLAEPLNLPACTGLLRSNTTCWDRMSQLMLEMDRWAASFQPGRRPASVGQTVMVRLADNACPDWVKGGCNVTFIMDGGYAVAARFLTADASTSENQIKSKLEAKYHPKLTKPIPRHCTNQATGIDVKDAHDYFWPVGNLYVAYWPLGGPNCDTGVVQIETATYHGLYQQAAAEHEANEPQL